MLRSPRMCCSHDRTPRHTPCGDDGEPGRWPAVGEEQLRPVANDPPCSWSTPGRKPGTSTNVTSRTLSNRRWTNRAALVDAAMSRAPASCRLLGDDADAPPAEAGDRRDDVLRPAGLDPEQVTRRRQRGLVYVIRLRRIVRDDPSSPRRVGRMDRRTPRAAINPRCSARERQDPPGVSAPSPRRASRHGRRR